mgnify:CR=1 FL=1
MEKEAGRRGGRWVREKKKGEEGGEGAWNSRCYNDERETVWQQSWFPACTNVFCFSK